LIHTLLFPLADIVIRPDLTGVPPNVVAGLVQLADNLAAVLLILSGVGIVLSLIGWMAGHWLGVHTLSERSRSGLVVSAGSGALLYLSVTAANYASGLFR